MLTWTKEDPLIRVKGETATANRALHDYAYLGHKRSFSNLLQKYAEDPQNAATLSMDTIKVWSAKSDWQARVAAWDELERQKEEAAFSQAAKEDRERRIAFLRAVRGVLTTSLNHWQDEIAQNPSAIPFRTMVASLTKVNAELRTEYGEATQRVDLTTGGKSLGEDAAKQVANERAEIERALARIAASLNAKRGTGGADKGMES